MTPETAASERRRKTHNSIYHHIYRASGICTKQSLARDLGLSLPTIYQHLAELVEDGLVAYSGAQRSTGGRRAAGLSAVDGARFAVGASITEDRIRFVAADLRLHELASRSIQHELSERFTGYGDFLREELDAFLDANGLDRAKLLGVGITLPGIISADNSRIVYAPTLQLQNIALGELTASLPYPFSIENDAACGGYAEWFMRSEQKNMAYLSLENGVGGAVLLEGRASSGTCASNRAALNAAVGGWAAWRPTAPRGASATTWESRRTNFLPLWPRGTGNMRPSGTTCSATSPPASTASA